MVARGGPPPGLGIRHDARPRAVVRAWFRPDDASVPLRGQRPVRLAPERRRRGDRAVPARFTGATHVGDAPLGNVCTSDRGSGGRGGGRFTREGATKTDLLARSWLGQAHVP